MRLGIGEFLLLLVIFTVTLGPTAMLWVSRWLRRAEKSSAEAARRRAAYEAQRRAEQDALLRRFQKASTGFAVAALLALAYALFLRPLDVAPQRYTAPPASEAVQASVTPAQPETLALGDYRDVRCIRVREGWVYLAVQDKAGGAIVRLRPDGAGLAEIVRTEGELTAFDFDAAGNIWFTAAGPAGGTLYRASYDGWGAAVEAVVTQIDGKAPACPTAVAAAPDGRIYFTEAAALSAEDGVEQALRTELLAHTATGRVYVYDPAARTVERVLSGLAGAAGLALSPDGQTLYVSELAGRCIWQMDAAARELTVGGRGCEEFASGLAYYPAGLACGADGTVYAGYLLPYNEWLESHAGAAFWRGVALRLPMRTQARILNFGADNPLGAGAYGADGTLELAFSAEGCSGILAVCPTEAGVYLGAAGGGSKLALARY